MENKICVCFGHREVYKPFSRKLTEVIEDLITHYGIVDFWTGGKGEFDKSFACAVREMKQKYPEIRLTLIKPYFSDELNKNREYYKYAFDDIVIPDVLIGIHPKAAITKRNRWMIEKSQFVVSYVFRNY